MADGKNGLRVVQLISANDTPGAYGFSPRPTPQLIATYQTHGPAVALSRGLDRDRAVDETGNQIAVFGRRGARPFNRRGAAADVPARRQAVHGDGRAAGTRDGRAGHGQPVKHPSNAPRNLFCRGELSHVRVPHPHAARAAVLRPWTD